jgi:hypothetical protein
VVTLGYISGEPLDRGGLNKVDAIAAIFYQRDTFRLAVATRRH